MKHTTTLAIAIAALIPMGAAVAGDGTKDKSNMGPSFDTLDTNRDGRVSQAEAGVDASIMFSSADRDGDGYLDKKEFKNRDKNSSGSPQQQSMPDSSSGEPSSSATDATVPPPATEPTPDTETPRQ